LTITFDFFYSISGNIPRNSPGYSYLNPKVVPLSDFQPKRYNTPQGSYRSLAHQANKDFRPLHPSGSTHVSFPICQEYHRHRCLSELDLTSVQASLLHHPEYSPRPVPEHIGGSGGGLRTGH
jgi:hypothetical protein